MNIMISIDSNYIIPAKVMLKSLSVNVKENLDVFLLYSRLDDDQIKEFSEFCAEKCNAIIHPIYIWILNFSMGCLLMTGSRLKHVFVS